MSTTAAKKAGEYIKYSDALLMFLLKGIRPEKYRERVQHDYKNIDPSTWTDAQIFAYRAGVPLAQVLAMKPEPEDDPPKTRGGQPVH